jgi:hypothetical protein
LQDPPKFTQIWIFGLKTNHLATLVTGIVARTTAPPKKAKRPFEKKRFQKINFN